MGNRAATMLTLAHLRRQPQLVCFNKVGVCPNLGCDELPSRQSPCHRYLCRFRHLRRPLTAPLPPRAPMH